MSLILRFGPAIGAAVAALGLAASAVAQTSEQGFRDPESGKVWTPDNVGQDGKPVAPADRAFDPSGQVVSSRGVVEQTVPTTFDSTVPITAGPNKPLVEIGEASLRLVLGNRWEVTLKLTNNSADSRSPVLMCRFSNQDKVVEEVRALLPPVSGGTRVVTTIQGPQAQIFVDHANCEVAST